MTRSTRSDFASALTAAIKHSGLTLDAVRQELAARGVQVSTATLSYWQNGRSQPTRGQSAQALTALEQVLGLETGELTSLAPVSPTRRRRRASHSVIGMPNTVEEVLALSGMSNQNLRKISTHISVVVDADRAQSAEIVRNVVQCLVAGTAAFPIVGEYSDHESREVHGLSNCHAGREWRLADNDVVLTEMELPRALRQGEMLMLEYVTALAANDEEMDVYAVAQPRLAELVLEVQFNSDRVPRRVVAFSTPTMDGQMGPDSPDVVELPLSDGVAQYIKVDVAPGIHQLCWEW